MTDRKRRVLVLNHFAAPRGHAGGTRHVEMFERLQGWAYLIVAADKNYLTGDRVDSGPGFLTVPVTAYTSNGWRRILNWASYAARALSVGLRQPAVSVVYASSPHLLTGLAGWAIASLRRLPFVLEIRDLWPKVLVDMGQLAESSPVCRCLSALESFLYSRADAIVVMAEGSRTELESRGVSADRIHYIPNGADPEDFVPSAEREELRRRFGFDRFTAVYAGAHGPANGLDLVLDAAEDLRDESIDIVLVGGGVSKEALVQDAQRRGLRNVRFLDPIPKTEIPDLLCAADAGLHVLADVPLFRSAVSPNKVFDYMAAGLPVLTNTPGLVAEMVAQAGAGLAVAPKEIAEGLYQLQLSQSQGTLSRQRACAREWVGTQHSRTTMAGRLADALHGAVASRRPR